MKREELVYTNKIYPSFTKFQVDEVCDTYEQRIKELEVQLENVQSSMYAENVDANMELIKANERIKELECDKAYLENDKQVCAECLRFKELEAENAMIKAQVPKWVSVKDRLPKDGVFVYAVGKYLEGLFCFKENYWYTKEDVEDDPNIHLEVPGYTKCAIDYWMEKPLSPPSTTEESSAVAAEKENR